MKKLKVSAIIQARMASSRLPGKVLLELGKNNKPVLWWMLKRASLSDAVDSVILATTSSASNDAIESFSKGCELWHHLFRYNGVEDDVIGRVLGAAQSTETDIIVDITSDCPMVDPRHITNLVNILIENPQVDYVSNCIKRSWPDGLDIQVYRTTVLSACKTLYRPKQHCGWNIAQHPQAFNCIHTPPKKELFWPNLGVTLDTKEDYDFLKIIFDKVKNDFSFSSDEIILSLREHDKVIINKNVRRKTPEEG